jgi:hypothetical protein
MGEEKAMKTFNINGHILDFKTHHGIKGLRVEAWDKNYIFGNKFLGHAITGGGGLFDIRFDESQFKHVFDQRPDLFVKVFRGDELIKSTEDNVLWNVDREDIQMDIEVEGAGNNSTTPTPETNNQVAMRGTLQATYTPRKPAQGESPSAAPRALEKGAFIACLLVSQDELNQLANSYKTRLQPVDASTPADNMQALKVVETLSTALSPTGQFDVLRNAKPLTGFQVDALIGVAEDLIALRRTALNQVLVAHNTILEAYKQQAAPGVSEVNVKTLMEWAIEKGIETQQAIATLALGRVLALKLAEIQPAQFGNLAARQLTRLRDRVQAFQQTMNTEPVGYLHLEKMSFTPAGIERGELVYSVPLSPGEEVNIKHREWSQTSEEFERIVTDYMEDFSEEGVTEKSELSQAVNSQTQHATAFNASVSTSGEAYGFSISASVGYNASDSASKSESLTRNHTRELTSKASSRVKQEHKISFRVASAVETEEQTVQRIVNPFSDRATRFDYYQLIRKWQVNLYRYGIRLTWDIVIPEPGAGLLGKIREIHRLQDELTKEFNLEEILGIKASQLSLDINEPLDSEKKYYGNIILEHGILLKESPPPLYDEMSLDFLEDYPQFHSCQGGWVPQNRVSKLITADIPSGYEVRGDRIHDPSGPKVRIEITNKWRTAGGDCYTYTYHIRDLSSNNYLFSMVGGKNDDFNQAPASYYERDPMNWDEEHGQWKDNIKAWIYHSSEYDGWAGRKGSIGVNLIAWNMMWVGFAIHVPIKLQPSVEQEWKQKVWSQIYEFKKEEYYEKRLKLQERLNNLIEELGSQDALSLRKKEREEVMKGALESLNIDPKDYYAHGEAIKFVQHAVEWENMLYFLYPYFWSNPDKKLGAESGKVEEQSESEYWEFKKYLDHPDPIHRAFLKAGAARVVLTIRPGFENAFLAFLNTPDPTNPQNIELLPSSPYFSIAKEFEAYAKTNYQGIPPANPVENDRPLLSLKQKKAWEKMQEIMQYLEAYRLWTYPKQYQTWKDMGEIMKLLNWYYHEHGNIYPPNLAELAQYFPDETVPQTDRWGNKYDYVSDQKEYRLVSYGADGKPGGKDENADLASMLAPKPQRDYPDTLAKLAQFFSDEVFFKNPNWSKDPWSQDYHYSYPGDYGEYDLASYGADGEPGGEGEDADITSWAEASLIGTWYEYTPTSALDIAFDEAIPKI